MRKMSTNTEKQGQEKERPQVPKPTEPRIVITEEAKDAIYVNFSRLFFSDHDFILELGQQLPAEEGKNIVRINLRIAMTPQTAERLGNRLLRFVSGYKKETESKKQKEEAAKDKPRLNTTI